MVEEELARDRVLVTCLLHEWELFLAQVFSPCDYDLEGSASDENYTLSRQVVDVLNIVDR